MGNKHFLVKGDLKSSFIDPARSRQVAPSVAILEIGFGINTGLFEFPIGHQVSAGRVDVPKCELFSMQVA